MQITFARYGGWNFRGFDIANHFSEWAGGTDDGHPDYSKFPTREQQAHFCSAYLEESGVEVTKDSINELLDEIAPFIQVSHLFWALWAVNQAGSEGCEDFPYLSYARARMKEFRRRVD